jgi:hypothetical protein
MPVKRRRLRRSERFDWDNLGLNDVFHLAYGRLPHRASMTIFNTKDDLREAYFVNRDRLVTVRGLDDGFRGDCYPNEPGNRPRAFWRFEATERPRFIGWRTIRLRIWQTSAWYTSKGIQAGDQIGRRKVFELQEDVLRRLGEMSDDEERLLDGIERAEAQHVHEAPADCRCRIHAKHRTYPRRLAPFLRP